MSNFDMTKQAEINHKEPGMTYNSISSHITIEAALGRFQEWN